MKRVLAQTFTKKISQIQRKRKQEYEKGLQGYNSENINNLFLEYNQEVLKKMKKPNNGMKITGNLQQSENALQNFYQCTKKTPIPYLVYSTLQRIEKNQLMPISAEEALFRLTQLWQNAISKTHVKFKNAYWDYSVYLSILQAWDNEDDNPDVVSYDEIFDPRSREQWRRLINREDIRGLRFKRIQLWSTGGYKTFFQEDQVFGGKSSIQPNHLHLVEEDQAGLFRILKNKHLIFADIALKFLKKFGMDVIMEEKMVLKYNKLKNKVNRQLASIKTLAKSLERVIDGTKRIFPTESEVLIDFANFGKVDIPQLMQGADYRQRDETIEQLVY